MEQLCRTCLKYNSINVNIFQHSQNNKYISDLIRELTSIKMKQIDGFPIHMCCNCLQKLNFILKFKEMVAQSDRRLHLMFRNKVAKDIKFVNSNVAIVCINKEPNITQGKHRFFLFESIAAAILFSCRDIK
ncbi:zinc-finger associated domain containing protein [Oryctes borbonicus]|uniref:Zinc-finger associated domain containing protein n=1 Tax=Oryctes borbonicus TaxID=1629725 RepID=A0A0T6AUI1_9SCAR|nr:zinc-finger associated domain containing protein [Oryctes borbonicus]